MILNKRNFLIGATASLGLFAAPAIVRCENLMGIKAFDNLSNEERYVTFLEAIYPGQMWYNHGGWCYNPHSQEIKVKPHMFNVNKLDSFMCNKSILPIKV